MEGRSEWNDGRRGMEGVDEGLGREWEGGITELR